MLFIYILRKCVFICHTFCYNNLLQNSKIREDMLDWDMMWLNHVLWTMLLVQKDVILCPLFATCHTLLVSWWTEVALSWESVLSKPAWHMYDLKSNVYYVLFGPSSFPYVFAVGVLLNLKCIWECIAVRPLCGFVCLWHVGNLFFEFVTSMSYRCDMQV